MTKFRSSCNTGKKDPHLGSVFFDVAFEYENRLNELHAIAQSIRKNEAAFTSIFGKSREDKGFSEGVLLGHLHRIIEQRDGEKLAIKDHCEICNSSPAICYRNVGQLPQTHLVVAPTLMDYSENTQPIVFLPYAQPATQPYIATGLG